MLPVSEADIRFRQAALAAEAEWNHRRESGGPVCRVELYDGKDPDDCVTLWRVSRPRPGLYRATVILQYGPDASPTLVGCESSRSDVVLFLRRNGVPALRIGSALPE